MTLPPRPAVLFAAAIAALLVAVPLRTPELWKHLAAGRWVLGGGALSATPLFDAAVYLLDGLAGDFGLAAGKAVAVALAAGLLARAGGGGTSAGFATGLAVLAAAPRLLPLLPNTASFLLLAILLDRLRAGASRWNLAVLLLIWANTDRWASVGLGVAGLTLLGRCLDRWRAGGPAGVRAALGTIAILTAAAALNPAVLLGRAGAFDFGGTAQLSARSPFTLEYRLLFASSPAGLAVFPLLALSAGSFLLGRFRWDRFLPWLLAAGLAGLQARLIPALAAVAAPALALNLLDRAGTSRPRPLARGAVGLAAAGLLVAAWPGWLLGPPYEPRRLAVDLPSGVRDAAAAVAGLPAGPGRTLHMSADTLHGFAWYVPTERGELADPSGVAAARFVTADGADRAVAFVPDPVRVTQADVVLAGADPGRLLFVGGGAAVWTRGPAPSPVDADRAGFGPAPTSPLAPTGFTRPRTFWPAARGEAAIWALLADASSADAGERHARTWAAADAASMVAAGAAGPTAAVSRLGVFRPPAGALQGFARGRDDVRPGPAYAAVRAARRATAADPDDAAAQQLLGDAYLRLLGGTRERGWAGSTGSLADLRRGQAVAALARAVELAPSRTPARLRLAQVYADTGLLDRAEAQLRAAGQDTTGLRKELDRRRPAPGEGRERVADRAARLAAAGLGGQALDLLLASDVAAFGVGGLDLELGLLARAGRAADVLAWATPDWEPALGPGPYRRLRAAAAAAVGEYEAADAELAALTGPPPPPAVLAGLVGNQALAALPGADLLPHLAWRALGTADFQGSVTRLVLSAVENDEVQAVRGLLALEAGDPARARALLLAARGTGAARTPGQKIAEDALEWVGGPGPR